MRMTTERNVIDVGYDLGQTTDLGNRWGERLRRASVPYLEEIETGNLDVGPRRRVHRH